MGGFGWAARQVATYFNTDQALGVEIVFLTGELHAAPGRQETLIHGTRLLLRSQKGFEYCRRVRAEGFDVLL